MRSLYREKDSSKTTHLNKDYMQKRLKLRLATGKMWENILPLFVQLYHGDMGPNLQKVFVRLTKDKEACVLVTEQDKKLVGLIIGNYWT